ncbi:isopenicillin N synthase family dioxygenase [Egbenema bharatensis]|uniref:isopenicillin N synthase family dioxygenase n=1 Tax=Egbenema bharatensis TaxID=3463334 RepID=UPI003A8B33C1
MNQTDRQPIPETIPVIDFRPFLQGDRAVQTTVAKQLYQACQQSGFVYLQHNLPSAQMEQLFEQMQGFFSLPESVKAQLMRSPETNCGYVPVAGERLNPERPGDWKEALNVGLQSTWLPGQSEFQQVVSSFYRDTTQLAFAVLKAFALAFDLPEFFFTNQHGQNLFLRLLHYPPLDESIAAQQIRAGEHTDYGSITLLFQDDVGGLEIWTGKEWIAAPTIPQTVLVNIGDAMQRWTNDQLRSTAHRVVNPVGVTRERSRYSAALFCDPNPEVMITCLETCCAADRPRYSPIRYDAYLQSKFAATY